MFREMCVHNGVMTLQSFYKDGKFYVFEAGFRMGGAQNYIFSQYQNNTNSLEYMLNYALTGSMSDISIVNADNARFRHPCCNYYVGLKPGTIAKMNDPEQIRSLPGVLNVTVMCREGAVIEDTNALKRICLRIHVVGETAEQLAENLVRMAGLTPYVDVDIIETVLRPDEKLYDELLMSSDTLTATKYEKIFVEQQEDISGEEMEAHLERLRRVLATESAPEIVRVMREIVPTFKTPEEVNSQAGKRVEQTT
jgi:hypothetical protein